MMERVSHLILFFSVFFMVSESADEYIKSVFMFGDSLFDPGNNPYMKNCKVQANFPPYGSTFFKRPTGRFTNGRTVADLIAQLMGIEFPKPFQEVKLLLANGSLKEIPASGVNFASAGSGVLPTTNKDVGVSTLEDQVKQLETLIDEKRIDEKQTSNSMFFLEGGSNDIFSSFFVPVKPDPTNHVNTLLKEVVRFVDKIYELGARRIVILSVGPMGCIPSKVTIPGVKIKDDQCDDKVMDMVKTYNAGLEALIDQIPEKFTGALGAFAAVFNVSQDISANPKEHGLVNVNEACCGGGRLKGELQCGLKGYTMCSNPNEFFFWDYFHPSEHTYQILADSFWTGDNTKIRPMNLKALAKITA